MWLPPCSESQGTALSRGQPPLASAASLRRSAAFAAWNDAPRPQSGMLIFIFWGFLSGQSHFKFRITGKDICGNMNADHSYSRLWGFHLIYIFVSPLSTLRNLVPMGTGEDSINIFRNYWFSLSRNTQIGQSQKSSINTIIMHIIAADTRVCQTSWNNLVNFQGSIFFFNCGYNTLNTKFSILVYNTVAFSTFTMLCRHHHHPCPSLFTL